MRGYTVPGRRYRRATWRRFVPLLPRLDRQRVPGMYQPAPPLAKRPSLLARLRAWLNRELIQP